MAASSSGTVSHSAPRVITNPPTCWLRCRGNPSSACASVRNRAIAGARGSSPAATARSSPSIASDQPSTAFASRSTASVEKPSAFPTSRTALRPRYEIISAVNAARSRPQRAYTCWITSSRRSCSKSMSMSGGSPRSFDTNRSNNMSSRAGSSAVMPRQ